jgi:hypothetical protein
MSRIFRKRFLIVERVGKRKRYQMWLAATCEIGARSGSVRIVQTQAHFLPVAVHVKDVFGAGGQVCLQAFGLIVQSRRDNPHLQLVLPRRELQVGCLVHHYGLEQAMTLCAGSQFLVKD